MAPPLFALRKNGLLNLPGASREAKAIAEGLLSQDAREHHCFYKAPSLHNHLSHHILAAYDLGAPASLLQKIYIQEAKVQRPILLGPNDKDIVVTAENWTTHTGNINAYSGFVKFFSETVQSSGILNSLEQFLFSPSANNNGANMLVRFVSGAFHPLIQVGYGVEFENETLVATGLAQTAVHPPLPSILFSFENPPDSARNVSSGEARQPSRGPSLLELLRQIYESPILKPVMPYDPKALIYDRLKAVMADGRPQEIRRICSQYYVDEDGGDEEFNAKVEECVWVSTLMMFGTGREGRKPRLDFFLMHLATSSFFFHPLFKLLKNPIHKANLLRAFAAGIALCALIRGRPVIKPQLLMSYTSTPRPPSSHSTQSSPHETCIGNPLEDADYNPWPTMIGSVIHAPDSHVLKTMRALVFAAQNYGDVPRGGAIGAFKSPSNVMDKLETLPGTSEIDGSIFVRAAGMLMDYMGWVTHGMPARADWDRSALGWDEAWDNEDD